MTLRRALIHLGALLWAVADPLTAQTVSGVVLDSLNGAPVGGVIVELTHPDAGAVTRAITDASGRYRLDARLGGRYRLRTLAVGFRAWESEPFDLGAGRTVERRIPIAPVIVALPAFTVEAERTCRVSSDEGWEASALWEEVRKALAATAATMEERWYRFRTVVADRTLNRERAVISVSEETPLLEASWPFGTLAPERLAAEGFVQPAEGGPVYYAPDAAVLVSDPFLDGHCFRLRRDVRRGLVGLAFEPVLDRDVPDVEGVLWLDAAGVALRSLEFRYVGLPRWAPENQVGGRVEFDRLPSGAWFMRSWWMRAPIAHVGGALADTTLAGYKERTGEVTEVFAADGELVVRYRE